MRTKVQDAADAARNAQFEANYLLNLSNVLDRIHERLAMVDIVPSNGCSIEFSRSEWRSLEKLLKREVGEDCEGE
jgi:hypothetical protein